MTSRQPEGQKQEAIVRGILNFKCTHKHDIHEFMRLSFLKILMSLRPFHNFCHQYPLINPTGLKNQTNKTKNNCYVG